MNQPWKTTVWNELVRIKVSVASMSCVLSGSGMTFHDFMCCKSCGILIQTPGVFFFFFSIIFFEIKLKSTNGAKAPKPFQQLLSAGMDLHPLCELCWGGIIHLKAHCGCWVRFEKQLASAELLLQKCGICLFVVLFLIPLVQLLLELCHL